MTDHLTLKWGTLKSWRVTRDTPAWDALQRYSNGGMCMSAMMQRDTPEQKQALCDLIDAIDCETIGNDWEGTQMSKDEAKAYVLGYGKD